MRASAAAAAMLALGALSSPARAGQVEIVPLVGYSSGHEFGDVAPEVQQVGLDGGVAWGGQLGVFVSHRLQLELSWTQHQSALGLRTAGGSAELFDVKIGRLHAGATYHFREPRRALRPYLTASLGPAFLGAPDLDTAARFSWALGAGVKLLGERRIGLKLQVRYDGTHLGGSDADPGCLPFGFCTSSIAQFGLFGGVIIRP